MIKINNTITTFETVYRSEYVPKDDELKEANCLILPYENFREGVDYCFSEYAQEVLQYSKDNPSGDLKLDIAATDENYKVIELHSMLLQIGIFIATSVVIPMAVGLVTNYTYDKIKKLHQAEEDVEVRVTFISVLPDGTSRALSYDGPANQLGQIVSELPKLTDSTIALPDSEESV